MNAKNRAHQPSPPDGRRQGRLPTRPSGPLPRCEGCAETVELCCECGQEQCRSCWADGDGALCGACRGRAWDDVPREDSVSPVGLLLGDDEQHCALNGSDDAKSLGILGLAIHPGRHQWVRSPGGPGPGVHLAVSDHHGTVLVGRSRSVDAVGLESAADDPQVRSALARHSEVTRRSGMNGGAFSAFAPMGGLGWTVTAEVPVPNALVGLVCGSPLC